MPFQSEAQRRFMYAQHPAIARRWEDSYGTPKGLPFHKGDRMRVKKRAKRKVRRGPESGHRATAAIYKRERAKGQELKRDPGDLVLTGKGTAAQERKRDPGELYSRSKKTSKAKPNAKAPVGQGGRFAALEQKLQGRKGVTDPGAVAAAIGRKKYGKSRFQKLGR